MSGSIGYCADRPDITAFIELHVEQGPVLDVERKDIGVVTGIVGQRRNNFTIFGQENHAGTTPMNMRDDALVKASSLVTYVNNFANEMYDGLVATVGELHVSPNSFSVIPGRVDLTLQVRDLDVNNMESLWKRYLKSLIYDTISYTTPNRHCVIPPSCMWSGMYQRIWDWKLSRCHLVLSHDAQNFTWCHGYDLCAIYRWRIITQMKKPPTRCVIMINVLTETIRRIDGKDWAVWLCEEYQPEGLHVWSIWLCSLPH